MEVLCLLIKWISCSNHILNKSFSLPKIVDCNQDGIKFSLHCPHSIFWSLQVQMYDSLRTIKAKYVLNSSSCHDQPLTWDAGNLMWMLSVMYIPCTIKNKTLSAFQWCLQNQILSLHEQYECICRFYPFWFESVKWTALYLYPIVLTRIHQWVVLNLSKLEQFFESQNTERQQVSWHIHTPASVTTGMFLSPFSQNVNATEFKLNLKVLAFKLRNNLVSPFSWSDQGFVCFKLFGFFHGQHWYFQKPFSYEPLGLFLSPEAFSSLSFILCCFFLKWRCLICQDLKR